MADESEGQAAEEVEVEVMEEVAGESEEGGGGMIIIIIVGLCVVAIVVGLVIYCISGSGCKPIKDLAEADVLNDCKSAVGEKAKDADTLVKVCKAEPADKCGTAKTPAGIQCCSKDGDPPKADAPPAGDQGAGENAGDTAQ